MQRKTLSSLIYTISGFFGNAKTELEKKYPTIESIDRKLLIFDDIERMPALAKIYYADIHGQWDKFDHLVHNQVFLLEEQINDAFPELSTEDKRTLYITCCYPNEATKRGIVSSQNYNQLFRNMLHLCNTAITDRYTTINLHKKLDRYENKAIIEQLLQLEGSITEQNEARLNNLINKLAESTLATKTLKETSELIKTSLVDTIVINGDIFDRGPDAISVMNYLMRIHENGQSVKINLGNHDMHPIGASAGSPFSVIDWTRIFLRYGEQATLEQGYGINLQPLINFTNIYYPLSTGKGYHPKVDKNYSSGIWTFDLLARAQKALLIILMKIDRDLGDLQKDATGIYLDVAGTKLYVSDQSLPTINWNNPHKLTAEESTLLKQLTREFKNNTKLRRHAQFLAEQGHLYSTIDQTLSFHGMLPVDEAGNFKTVTIHNKQLSGKALLDHLEDCLHSIFADHRGRNKNTPYLLWRWAESPLFGKHKMQTRNVAFFNSTENTSPETKALIKDVQKEIKAPFYTLIEDPLKADALVENILTEFSYDPERPLRRIVVGHVVKKADEAIRAHGRFFYGDGGFSKAYAQEGSQGLCFIETSNKTALLQLDHPVSKDDFFNRGSDITPKEAYQEKFIADLPPTILIPYFGPDRDHWPETIRSLFLDYTQDILQWHSTFADQKSLYDIIAALDLTPRQRASLFKTLSGWVNRPRQVRDTDAYKKIKETRAALIILREKYAAQQNLRP